MYGRPPVAVSLQLRGSRGLTDVVWSKYGREEVFVSPPVVRALSALDPEPETVPLRVDVAESRPAGTGSRAALVRALCVELEEYRELRPVARAPVDVALGGLQAAEDAQPCAVCGRFSIKWTPPGPRAPGVPQPPVAFVPGAEYFERTSMEITALDEMFMAHELRPARPGGGVVFRAADVAGAHLWRASQDETALLCSQEFKGVVQALEATNVHFLQVGRIVD